MSTKDFILALARGARGKDAAKALILPQIFGGTGYVNAGTELTVTGTPPLSLPKSTGKPLKACEVTLSPYQDMHGYDNPWPAGGGKNKLPITATTNTVSDVTFTINANGTISTSGTASASIVFNVATNLSISGTDAILSGCPDGGSDDGYYMTARLNNAWPSTHDTGSGLNLYGTIDRVAIVVASGVNMNGITFYPMIRNSSESSTFAPYSNICPIHGTDKLNLFVEESYDPAATPKVVITFDNTVYGGTYDAVTGVGEITNVSVDMGSLTWTKEQDINQLYYFFRAAPSTEKAQNTNFICESYKAVKKNRNQLNNGEMGVQNTNPSGYKQFAVRNDLYADSTGEQFATAMSDVKVVYELATPVPFTTDGHTITLHKGTATTWATAEDGTVDSMSVTYVSKK